MILRFHEIAESRHRILNPFSDAKLDLLGEICQPMAGTRHLDLACGKGELLCRWAARYATIGVGVDISAVFLTAAARRAAELDVADVIDLIEGDAATYVADPPGFAVASCLGATWIGGGLVGTMELLRRALDPHRDGLLLVGEAFWREPPAEVALDALGIAPGDYTDLTGTLERIGHGGGELVEMVLADEDDWDRYLAAQWWTLHHWLRDHPDDPDHDELAAWFDRERHGYLAHGRRALGWGVFVIRPRSG